MPMRQRRGSGRRKKSPRFPQLDRKNIEQVGGDDINQDKPILTIKNVPSPQGIITLLEELATADENDTLTVTVTLLREQIGKSRALEEETHTLRHELYVAQTQVAVQRGEISHLASLMHQNYLLFGIGGVAAGVGLGVIVTSGKLVPLTVLFSVVGFLLMWIRARKPKDTQGPIV